jgi:hypothetical protein
MKRTRSKGVKINFSEPEDDIEMSEEEVETNAKKKKKNIPKRTKKSNKNESQILKESAKKEEKEFEMVFPEDYLEFLEQIEKNMKEYSEKPKYIEKPYDQKNKVFQKLTKLGGFKIISPLECYYKLKYEQFHKLSLEEDKCSICQFNFYDDDLKDKSLQEVKEINEKQKNEYDCVMLNKCSDHFFHIECLQNLMGDKESVKCPNCNKIYGIITGDQPKGTFRAYSTKDYKCTGYEKYETIVLDYEFPNGKGYTGTSRTAFLPNNKEGREILGLLKVSFDRRLTFAVGTSVTTGASNTVVWNGVHHKTNTHGGSTQFGYPDPTYFNRLKQELAAKGVIEENIDENLEDIANEMLKSTGNKKRKR